MCDLSLVHSLFPDCHKALQTSKSPLLQDMCTIHHNTWARQDCQCFLLFETHSPDSGIGSSGSQNAHVVGPRLKDTPHRALIWRPLPSPPEPEPVVDPGAETCIWDRTSFSPRLLRARRRRRVATCLAPPGWDWIPRFSSPLLNGVDGSDRVR